MAVEAPISQPEFLDAARALYIDGVTAEVVTRLDDAGIPAIVLKGPSIARWLYPAGGRTYADTDLLVPPAEFARAGDVLRSLGFRELLGGFDPHEWAPDGETSFLKARTPDDPLGGKIDLHRNLPGLPADDDVLWRAFAERCEPLALGGVRVQVLNRVGLALHIVVHALQHGFGSHTDEDLRRAIDALPLDGWRQAVALGERLGVAPDVVGTALRRHPEGAALADRLGLGAQTLSGTPYFWSGAGVPRGAQTLSQLRKATTGRERARIVRWTLLPSPAKVRYSSWQGAARERSLAVDYLRYWCSLVKLLRPAVRFSVNGERARPAP